MDGILIVDKPLSKTSFDVVRDVRKAYNTKKVGHIGTLDPMASGVLPVLVGKATRLSNYLMEHDKDYIATLRLGVQTDTGDSEGKIINHKPVIWNKFQNYTSQDMLGSHIGVSSTIPESDVINFSLQKILDSFLGESSQVPPMYSAIKMNGKKLYELAREGKTVERKARKIFISRIELLEVNQAQSEITFKVTCSKGTYIRTLCEDIAINIGTCGYMKSLRRTRVGDFKIEDAGKFIDLKDIFTDIPTINVQDYSKLENGINIQVPLNESIDNNYSGFANLYYENSFVGIGKVYRNHYKRFILI